MPIFCAKRRDSLSDLGDAKDLLSSASIYTHPCLRGLCPTFECVLFVGHFGWDVSLAPFLWSGIGVVGGVGHLPRVQRPSVVCMYTLWG